MLLTACWTDRSPRKAEPQPLEQATPVERDVQPEQRTPRSSKLGLAPASPMDGAFYAYVDVSRFTNDSMDFARRMLAEINVAATPGLDFDPVEGPRTLRISYAGSEAEIAEALERIGAWLK